MRIRESILVTAFAAAMCLALVSPVQAAQVPADHFDTGSSAGCEVDPRLMHSDPQMCSQPVFADLTEEAGAQSTTSVSSSPSPWIVSLIGVTIGGLAALAFALLHRPAPHRLIG